MLEVESQLPSCLCIIGSSVTPIDLKHILVWSRPWSPVTRLQAECVTAVWGDLGLSGVSVAVETLLETNSIRFPGHSLS